MTKIVTLAELPSSARGGVVSIGNFDGVHLGHARLLRQTRELADELGGPAIAMVLAPHPLAVLRPQDAPQQITPVPLRAERMAPLGIDFLVTCEVDASFLAQSAETFFADRIVDQLSAAGLVEGPNFFFGAGRRGDVAVLQRLADQAGIRLRITEKEITGSEMVSSSRIRQSLLRGDIAESRAMLGWNHVIEGVVTRGERRGRRLGFPTANLARIEALVPADGVYCGIAGGRHVAAIHIGPNPTFSEHGPQKVEIHLLDYDGDLYEQRLRVEFHHRIRDIQKFVSPDQLVAQLKLDLQFTRQHVRLAGG